MKDTFQTNRGLTGPLKTATARPTASDTTRSGVIPPLVYRPRAPYRLDLEVFSVADLRQRGSKEDVQATHRYEFHAVVCVTQGTCTQVVDFEPIACVPGSLLVLHPGQAHNYGRNDDWDGWNVLFRPQFVQPISKPPRELGIAFDMNRLPAHIVLGSEQLQAVTSAIQQMREDAQIDAPPNDVHALLRHQLHALLTRLAIVQGHQQAHAPVISPALQRFKRFQQLVEECFARWHQVADYAKHLGYSEKSLARAVEAAMGMTAKAFIAARVNLEAKRLLVHTDLTIASIAEKLGFEEATNFSKFFKREVGCTPLEFRQRQRATF